MLTVRVGTSTTCARCDEWKSKAQRGEETANTVKLHWDEILADDRMAGGPLCFGLL